MRAAFPDRITMNNIDTYKEYIQDTVIAPLERMMGSEQEEVNLWEKYSPLGGFPKKDSLYKSVLHTMMVTYYDKYLNGDVHLCRPNMENVRWHMKHTIVHNDNKKVLHIDKLQGTDLRQLMRGFFNDDAECEEVVEDAEEVSEETEALRNDAELVEKLEPIFYNNETDVKSFLKEISGMKPGDITDLVNRWVKDKRISDYGYSRKGELWEILNKAGLYPRSRQNWCKRVD